MSFQEPITPESHSTSIILRKGCGLKAELAQCLTGDYELYQQYQCNKLKKTNMVSGEDDVIPEPNLFTVSITSRILRKGCGLKSDGGACTVLNL